MKRIDIKIYLTLFFIAFFAELFFFSQEKKDLISIIGLAVVLLISAYLAVDSFHHHLELQNQLVINAVMEASNARNHGRSKAEEAAALESANEAPIQSAEMLKRVETVNKAIYVSLKKGLDGVDEQYNALQKSIGLIEEIQNDSVEETLKIQKEILELNNKMYDNQMKIYDFMKEYMKEHSEIES